MKICVRCPSVCRYMLSCTFWCWVLSDESLKKGLRVIVQVLMHLLVLGAF